MVAVQIWPYNLGKPFFKKIKIKQINYVISSTNKSNVFLERLNKSNNIFEKFSLWEKLHHKKEENEKKETLMREPMLLRPCPCRGKIQLACFWWSAYVLRSG